MAIKMPILISPKVKIKGIRRGVVTIDTRIIKKNMIMIGMDTGSACLPNNGATHLYLSGKNSKIIFKGSCIISNGTGIRIDNCHLSIGNNFYCNSGCYFKLTEDTVIGNDCMFGWNITLSTSDGHNVIKGNKHISMQGPINIDDHVWVCSNSTLTKNSYIPRGSIVSQYSLVNKEFSGTNLLIGGIPARIISQDTQWHR